MQCWYGVEADPGGLKVMWVQIMTGLNCEALSAGLSCDDHRKKLFTQKARREQGTNIAAGLSSAKELRGERARFTMTH